MAGMKVVSFVDSEIAKARQVAVADLEELQRKLLGVTTRLAESMVTLADRVTELEHRRNE